MGFLKKINDIKLTFAPKITSVSDLVLKFIIIVNKAKSVSVVLKFIIVAQKKSTFSEGSYIGKLLIYCCGCSMIVISYVKSVKSIQLYLSFFKRVVNIAILELGLVSNESPGNFTIYSRILNPSIFVKSKGFFLFCAIIVFIISLHKEIVNIL